MINFGDYIDPLVFLIALSAGLVYTYLSTPQPQIIIKYPTPFNVGKVKYVDDSGVCYRYKMNKVMCPNDKTKIQTYDFQ